MFAPLSVMWMTTLSIVRAVIALADAFGLAVVAEGVETSAAAEILLRHGCYRAQGFLLSKPLVSAAMSKLFARKYIELPFATSQRAAPGLR